MRFRAQLSLIQVQKFDMIVVCRKIRGCQLYWFEAEFDSARAMFNLLRVRVYTHAEGGKCVEASACPGLRQEKSLLGPGGVVLFLLSYDCRAYLGLIGSGGSGLCCGLGATSTK